MAEGPIGRQTEWRTLVEWLADGRSGLLVIQGEPGSGRSHLLTSFGDLAQSQGFAVAGCADPFPVDDTTQVSDVLRTLAALIGAEVPAAPGETDGFWSQVVGGFRAGYNQERALPPLLKDAGPLLLGFDGYSPNGRVESWVSGALLTAFKTSARPMVLVIVDRSSRLERARKSADLVITLESLDADELRAYFTRVSESMEPPLSNGEIERYTDVSAEDPMVFSALNTVLLATQSSDVM